MPRLIKDQYIEYYQKRGVPTGILFKPALDNLVDHLTTIRYEVNGDPKKVTVAKQQEFMKEMLDLSDPYLAVVSGETDDSFSSQIALIQCAQMMLLDSTRKFYWHSLTGAFKDKIRDDEVLQADVYSSHLLIISNIAKNSTNVKLEKLRDICEMYSHIPKIVVLAGVNPMEFCRTQLFIKPTYALYSGQ
jgi:hypothetical protein